MPTTFYNLILFIWRASFKYQIAQYFELIKQTSYWSKTGFFSQLKIIINFHPEISQYYPKIT